MFKFIQYKHGKFIQYNDIGILLYFHTPDLKRKNLPNFPNEFLKTHNLSYYISYARDDEYFYYKNIDNEFVPITKEQIKKELALRKFNNDFENKLV